MGNSSFTLQNLVDDARTVAEFAPVLPTGGFATMPALSMANDVMTAMLAGSYRGSPFNFKFNRFLVTPFYLNSYQQDYFIPGLVQLGWLESCFATNFSSTVFPKPVRYVEVRRDVLVTSAENGNLAKIQWMQNDTLEVGTWGQSAAIQTLGLQNPGPGVVITNPVGLTAMPVNPFTCIKDAFGNCWVVTTYGTCGNSNPFISNLNPVFPTLNNQNIVATTVTDGSVVWTAVNPKGQGFRVNPQPTQTGPVWQINPIAQYRVPKFVNLQQFIEPIPDDYFSYFKDGFFAQCARRSADPKVRARFKDEWELWMHSLNAAVSQGSREQDDWGFVPSTSVMDTGWAFNMVTPAQPYGPWAG